jgi:hypothetical protein
MLYKISYEFYERVERRGEERSEKRGVMSESHMSFMRG